MFEMDNENFLDTEHIEYSKNRDRMNKIYAKYEGSLQADVSQVSLATLDQGTAFTTGRQLSAKAANINKFLQDWGGTTKGLGSEWIAQSDSRPGRPICKKCGKFRCCHQIYSGKI